MKKIDPDSDEAIRSMLVEHPGLLDVTRGEADRAIDRCHRLNQAPRGWILWKIEQFRARVREQSRQAGGDKVAVDVASFREFRAATAAFLALADQWERARDRDGLRALNAELEREMADEAHRLRVASWPKPGPLPPFDARGFVAGLASRGVMLIADADGGLSAMPASKLTDQDRAAIQANRAAVAGAAASMVETL